MNISFFLTQRQFKERSKLVTRRNGWRNLKPGTILTGVVKGQGLKRGERAEVLGRIWVKDVRRERLHRMHLDQEYGKAECILEGFPEMRPIQFVDMYCAHNKCDRMDEVTRIEFRYVCHIRMKGEELFTDCVVNCRNMPDPDALHVTILDPSSWMRIAERKRGIFSRDTIDLNLFLDHNKEWTDSSFLKQWELMHL